MDNLLDVPLPEVSDALEDRGIAAALVSLLEAEAFKLQDDSYRAQAASIRRGTHTDIWPWLSLAWRDLVAAEVVEQGEDGDLLPLATALSRFSRNIVAEVPENQAKMLVNEGSMRSLLYDVSAYVYVSDEAYMPLIRSLTQAVSNLLTGNETIASLLLPIYVGTTFDANILIRLLSSKDIKTLFSVVVLLRNCLDACPAGAVLFCQNDDRGCGLSVAEQLLRLVETWFECEEEAAEAAAFEAGYEVFRHIFSGASMSAMYSNLQHPDPSETITLAQSTLLKLFDAYLQSSLTPATNRSAAFLFPTAIRLLHALSAGMELVDGVPRAGAAPFSDLRFEKVYEGAILALQGLLKVGLGEKEHRSSKASGDMEEDGDKAGGALETDVIGELKASCSAENGGIISLALKLLKQADAIEPRLIRSRNPVAPTADPREEMGPRGFAFLRRDLVRIIGLLAFEDKAMQDLVRERGGVEAVLSLSAMDDRNPYLREHALFTIRCLLVDNEANQALVKGLEPMGVINEDGELGDMPDRWKKV